MLIWFRILLLIIKSPLSLGIGDGGNELGMGKLKEKVMAFITNGRLTACDVPADYAITAGMDKKTHQPSVCTQCFYRFVQRFVQNWKIVLVDRCLSYFTYVWAVYVQKWLTL